MNSDRIIIGITGATGVIYGIRLLELLRPTTIETHLIVSKAAQLTRTHETNLSLAEVRAMADVYHSWNDIGASIASGSFPTLGMIVAPCSMKTLAQITHGTSDNLIGRAADVTLKERRKLVIMPRESPLHLGHLQNMVSLTQKGAIICPAMPTFYTKPATIDDLINYSVGRMLALFEIDVGVVNPWQG